MDAHHLDYVIRPLTTEDEPLLWKILYQGVHPGEGQPDPPAEIVRQPELARHVEGWGRPSDRGFVAHDRDEGRAIGAVWCRSPQGQGEGAEATPELALAVAPPDRRKGIGAALLTQFVKANPEQSAITISAGPGNPAVRLYERFGFKVVHEGPHSVTMRREA